MNKESSIIERIKQYEPLWDGWTYSGKQFGTGGSGCVLGLQRENKFSVVKVIYVDKNSQNYNAVKNEIETMVTLRSDYLVECLDYRIENVYNRKGEVIGYDFLIHMNEYLPFSEYLREEEYDPNRLCIQLAREIGYALCFLHSKGILHRDIKPENIFIDNSNNEQHFRLGDFGVSKKISDLSGLTATGTLNFMAPESFMYYEYSYRSDIYNLGMTLYYILNDLSFPVFEESNSQSDFDYNSERRLRGDKLPEPVFGSDTLKKVVLKCCEAKPKDRYNDVSDMLNVLFGQKISPSGVKRPKDNSNSTRKIKKRKKYIWIIPIVCAAVAAASAVVLVLFLQGDLTANNEASNFTTVATTASPTEPETDPKLSLYTVDFINEQQNKIKEKYEINKRKDTKNVLNKKYEATEFEDGSVEVKVLPSSDKGWDIYKYYTLYEFDEKGNVIFIRSEQKYESCSIYVYNNDIIRVAVGGGNPVTIDYGDERMEPKYQVLVNNAHDIYTNAKQELDKEGEIQ